MSGPWAALRDAAKTLAVPIDAAFEPRAGRYLEELRRWTRVSRLTGYATEGEQVAHLLLDSLLLLQVLPQPASPLLDIGSGNGAPGLVLKLARPGWRVTLVEANRRRANFLRHVIRELALEGVAVREARAEALVLAEPGLGRAFQTVTMRAVASPPRAAALARPYLAPRGHLVLPLGPGQAPAFGQQRTVVPPPAAAGLSNPRAFLIIGADEIPGDVPRGTRGVSGPSPGDRESERRRR